MMSPENSNSKRSAHPEVQEAPEPKALLSVSALQPFYSAEAEKEPLRASRFCL
ncbi:rCG41501 [Rattus norvegicus]|uniref:RCG41501 n=1 Tax=Rattus norvegicus TaxID=10116 RepID=A6IHT0_RAT|nr:rCG41501 [Rattus norvegicus]